jgi:hypothetical protein
MANFKPNVGKKVSKDEVEKGIKKFGEKYRTEKTDTKSIFFGRDVLLRMLSQDESTGITFFLTLQPNPNSETKKDTIQLALVPTKEDGTLIWNDEDPAAAVTSAKAIPTASSYDAGSLCPPYCPK